MSLPSRTIRLELELELDPHDDHVAGRIGDGRGQPLPFTGWLELMAAIEALKHPGPAIGTGGART